MDTTISHPTSTQASMFPSRSALDSRRVAARIGTGFLAGFGADYLLGGDIGHFSHQGEGASRSSSINSHPTPIYHDVPDLYNIADVRSNSNSSNGQIVPPTANGTDEVNHACVYPLISTGTGVSRLIRRLLIAGGCGGLKQYFII